MMLLLPIISDTDLLSVDGPLLLHLRFYCDEITNLRERRVKSASMGGLSYEESFALMIPKRVG